MKIDLNKNMTPITAAVNKKEVLEDALRDVLDDDLCEDIVDMAYSEDDQFEEDRFEDIDTLCEIYMNDQDPLEIVRRFWFGDDLDSGDIDSSNNHANPNRDYARFNGYGNIQTTDYPGDVYKDELLEEIIDYIMDHLDDREFPEEVEELIEKYMPQDEDDDEEDEE